MRFGSLFAGIGGIDLGLERAGMECAWQVEIDEFCLKVLEKHWPDVPKYKDVCTVTQLPYVDLICGGFPCQPFSSAARGRYTALDLWPEMLRVIEINKPEYVIAENVARKPIKKAEEDVRRIGYETGIRCIGAYEIGADHRRNRWWLFAHANDKGKLDSALHAEVALLPTIRDDIWGRTSFAETSRVSNGTSNRMDRLRTLGNAVVPQVAEWIGRRILSVASNDATTNEIDTEEIE